MVYIPTGPAVITAKAGGTIYQGTVTTLDDNSAAADLTPVESLTGTVSIGGTQKYDEILTATVNVCNADAGTLSYQWQRQSSDISGATGTTYRLKAEDVGKTIGCVVSGSVKNGTISGITGIIEKADGRAVGSISRTNCTTPANNDGTMTLPADAEYSTDGAVWISGSGIRTISGLQNGTYKVRMGETATYKVGAETDVVIGAYAPPTPGSNHSSPAIYTVPVESGDNSLNASATVSGGTATVSIDEDKLEALLHDAKTSGDIAIDIGLCRNVDAAIIPTSVIGSIGEAANDSSKDINGAEISLDAGTVFLDKKAVSSLAEQAQDDTVTIRVDEVTKLDLSDTQKDAIAGAHADDLIVDVTIRSGKSVISNFGGGLITVTLPYELKEGQVASGVSVWHLASDGTMTLMECKYDEAAKTVSFVTNHLSDFIVGYDESATWVNPYDDVDEGDYFYGPVLWAAARGITQGTGLKTFGPDESCTRGQMATFLWRAAGSPEPKAELNPFKDVKAGDYCYKAVLWAVEAGITNGANADGTLFEPEQTCTRGQMSTFLYRYAGSPDVAGSNPFTDVAASDFYASSVTWAASQGITQGANGAGTAFSPMAACTRGQIVTFLWRTAGSPDPKAEL